MDLKNHKTKEKSEKDMSKTKPDDTGKIAISGHIKIFDPNSGEVIG